MRDCVQPSGSAPMSRFSVRYREIFQPDSVGRNCTCSRLDRMIEWPSS
jgi:hypothetical protein